MITGSNVEAARQTCIVLSLALGLVAGGCGNPGAGAALRVRPRDGHKVSAADRARVERWYADKQRGHIETRPPSPRWGDRWVFINGHEVDLETFTACVTTPGHFRLGPDSQLRYGDRHVESICCPDRTIFIDSADQECASWSMPGRCQHAEWLELMLTDDGRVLGLDAHAPACEHLLPPPPQPSELEDHHDAPPIG